MFDRVKNYIVDSEFRLTLYNDMVHVVNYIKILSLEENRIVIRSDQKRIIIIGNHLHLNRLLDEEVLIKGEVLNIEVENV